MEQRGAQSSSREGLRSARDEIDRQLARVDAIEAENERLKLNWKRATQQWQQEREHLKVSLGISPGLS